MRKSAIIFALLLQIALFTFLLKDQALYDGPFKNDLHGHETYVSLFKTYWAKGSLGLDAWDNQCCFGAPVFRTYQHLSHMGTALLSQLTGLSVSRSLNLVLCFFLILHGLSFFLAGRILRLPDAISVLAAWLSPFIVDIVTFGHQSSSYLYNGYGVFTQAVGLPFFVVTIAGITRLVDSPSSRIWATVTALGLSLTFALHLFLGDFAICLLTILGVLGLCQKRLRPTDLLFVWGIPALALLATNGYQLLSIWQDRPLMHAVESVVPRKTQGYGLWYVGVHLINGDLLDAGRFPLFTLLMWLGLFSSWRKRDLPFLRVWVICWVLGVLLLSGRHTFGPLLDILPGIYYVHLERAAILIEISSVFLASAGTYWLVTLFPRQQISGTLLAVAIVSYLCIAPLRDYRENRRSVLAQSKSNLTIDTELLSVAQQQPGYFWSRYLNGESAKQRMSVGEIPYCYVASHFNLAQLVRRTHTMTFPSQMVYFFDYKNPAHYSIFNIATVGEKDSATLDLAFLRPLYRGNGLTLWATPSLGWFELVGIALSQIIPQSSSYVNAIDQWLTANPSADSYAAIVPEAIARAFASAVPKAISKRVEGKVLSQGATDLNTFSAKIQTSEAGTAVFKAAYHPGWRIEENGKRVTPTWVGLGFMAFPVEKGINRIAFHFTEDPVRAFLFWVAIVSYSLLVGLVCWLIALDKSGIRRPPT